MLASDPKFHERKTLNNFVILNYRGKFVDPHDIANQLTREFKNKDLSFTGKFIYSFKQLTEEDIEIDIFFQVDDISTNCEYKYTSYIQFNDYISSYIYPDLTTNFKIGLKKIVRYIIERRLEISSFPYVIADIKKPDRIELLIMVNTLKHFNV